jgi:hypothetical protein
MEVYIVTYNGAVSSEGYGDIDRAIAFIENRYGIERFQKVTPMHYSDGENCYKIHPVRILK